MLFSTFNNQFNKHNTYVVDCNRNDLCSPSSGASGSTPSNQQHHEDKQHDQGGTVIVPILPSGYEYSEEDKRECPGTGDRKSHEYIYFKFSSVDNVAEKLLGGEYEEIIKEAAVTHIAGYKRPLEFLWKQWSPVDYHAFLVLKTNIGIYLTLEKLGDGIYIGKGPLINGSACEACTFPRNSELMIEDESKYALSELIELLKNEKDDYRLLKYNCQDFAKICFDKIARMERWGFVSFQEFLKNLIFLLVLVIIIVFIAALVYQEKRHYSLLKQYEQLKSAVVT